LPTALALDLLAGAADVQSGGRAVAAAAAAADESLFVALDTFRGEGEGMEEGGGVRGEGCSLITSCRGV